MTGYFGGGGGGKGDTEGEGSASDGSVWNLGKGDGTIYNDRKP